MIIEKLKKDYSENDMVENKTDRQLQPSNCHQISHVERNGEILLRRVLIVRNETLYSVQVTTPEYLAEIKRENEMTPDPDLRLDNNAIVFDNIEDLSEVCNKLAQKPFEQLKPFLEEFEIPEE